MTRQRPLAALGLSISIAVAIGCGKKTDSTPEVAVAPVPKPAPSAEDVEKTAKAEALNRLKQIGLAMHKYHDTYRQFPAGYATAKGEFGLSWRVAILPYLDSKEDAALLKEFKLNEPWNSEHNKKLIEKMPKVFESAGKEAPAGQTYFRSFMGEMAFIQTRPGAMKGAKPTPVFPTPPGLGIPGQRITSITDGTSGTLAVAEAAEPVEWTKPDDLPVPGFVFDPNPAPLPKLGGVFPGGFHGLMCDGAQHFFPDSLSEKTLRAMITTNGGEVLDKDAADILFPPKPPKPGPPTTVPSDLPDAAARKTAVENCLAIVKGMHHYHDVYNYLPAGILANKAVGLSWRVQILPYIGEEKLFKEFKLTEPWDSEHNKALIERMPKAFESAGKPAAKGHTFIRTTMGPGGLIPWNLGAKAGPGGIPPDRQPGTPLPGRPLFAGIPDGISNTILFVEATDAVPWTKPEGLFLPPPLDPKGGGLLIEPKLPPLGGAFADGFHAAMADGRITFYKSGYPSGALAKLFCPNDGWLVEPFGEPDKILYSIPFVPPTGARPPGNTDSGKGGVPPTPPKSPH